ncbi:hypothetical protein NEOLEDRAFT_936969 [Neolentinus lepideus HHB14362 ss-1]|uniref:Uncharacterized protein n=1 Tax=Neolentinus lepideus HHB14362 ss-1 TaxID=1314782 RepID=A0A165NJ82_9AGAM|nr:hypothetical protein NEOLEDRAFT_936969 [Neolentinus lepideus HHB14362 ss-1]
MHVINTASPGHMHNVTSKFPRSPLRLSLLVDVHNSSIPSVTTQRRTLVILMDNAGHGLDSVTVLHAYSQDCCLPVVGLQVLLFPPSLLLVPSL